MEKLLLSILFAIIMVLIILNLMVSVQARHYDTVNRPNNYNVEERRGMDEPEVELTNSEISLVGRHVE